MSRESSIPKRLPESSVTSVALILPFEPVQPPAEPSDRVGAGVSASAATVVANSTFAAAGAGAAVGDGEDQAVELRNAQDALRDSEARYRAMTALSSDWYWEHDTDQRFTVISEHAQERTGIHPSALIGRTPWETDIRYDDEERRRLDACMLERRPFYDFQYARASGDGTVRHLSISGEPMVDAAGVYIGYRGIGRDITERKRALAAVAESERFTRATLDALEDHVCVLEASGTIIMVNRAWRRFLAANAGDGARDFVGSSYLDACDRAQGEGRADGLAVSAGIRRVIAGESEQFRYEYRCDAGLVNRWFGMTVTRFPGAGTVRVVVAHENITSSKEEAASVERVNAFNRALAEVDEAIIRIPDRAALIGEVASIAARAGPFEALRIWLPDTGAGFIAAASKGRTGDDLDEPIRIAGEVPSTRAASLVAAVLQGHAEVCNDLDLRADVPWLQRGDCSATGSFAGVPLRLYGCVTGAIGAYSARRGSFDARTVDLLQRIAESLSFALDKFERDAERRATEEALRESEARFRSLTDLSADWYWQQDAELRFTSPCNGAEIVAGLTPDADLGKLRWELDGMGEGDWDLHRATLASRRPFRDFEVKRTFPDGSLRDISLSGEPIYDAHGVFCGYRGVGRDITQRKHEARILALEHRVAGSLAECALADGVEAVIRAFCEMQGWASGVYFDADDATQTLRARDCWATADPLSQRFVARARDLTVPRSAGICGHVWRVGQPVCVPDINLDDSVFGRNLILDSGARGAFGFPSTLRGKTVGVFVFFSHAVREPDERLLAAARVIGAQVGQFVERRHADDALRESEARYRALTALSSDWYWEHDQHQRITRLSDGAGNHTLGARWDAMTHSDPARRDVLEAELRERKPFRDFEYFCIGDDGARRDFQLSGEPMHDASGRYTGYRGIGRDISERKRGEDQQRFQALLLGTVGDAVVATDNSGRITYWNTYAEQLYGWPSEDAIGADVLTMTGSDDERSTGLAEMLQVAKEGVWRGETLARRRSGELFPAHLTLAAIPDATGSIVGLIGVSRDISDVKRVERLVRDNARQQSVIAAFGQRALASRHLDDLLEHVVDAIVEGLGISRCGVLQLTPDALSLVAKAGRGHDSACDGHVAKIEAGTQERFVVDAAEPLVVVDYASDVRFVVPETGITEGMRSAVVVPVVGVGGCFGLLSAYSADVGRFPQSSVDFVQSLANTLGTAIDRRAAEEKLAYLAQFDVLTGLPNRSLLRDRLTHVIALAAREGWSAGVMFIDLDGFKSVNDTYGHGVGDELLIRVARRLKGAVRDDDTVGRQGGDEFAIVLSHLTKADDAGVVATHVLKALARPFNLGGHEVQVSASIGVAIYPGDGQTPEMLLKNADTAMYHAKEQGRNCCQFFTEDLNARIDRRIALEQELRPAAEPPKLTPP
jgi:diguanylate cyclase (GGDEF)-like protein/PAS domain S-box-containing protein